MSSSLSLHSSFIPSFADLPDRVSPFYCFLCSPILVMICALWLLCCFSLKGLVSKNSPTTVSITKFPTWEKKKQISNRNLFKLSCVMEKSIDGNTHSVVNTTPDCLNGSLKLLSFFLNWTHEFVVFVLMECAPCSFLFAAINVKEEASVATLLMNLDNKFDPFDAMSTPLYQTATFKQVLNFDNVLLLLHA